MPRPSASSNGQVHPAVALVFGLLAIVGLVAAVTIGPGAPAAPAGSPTPSASPTAPYTPAPTQVPASPTPAPTASSNGVVRIPLDIADDHSVVVALQDADGLLVSARTGRAADGMSVRWHDAALERVNASTIRVTWVGMAVDEQVDVAVEAHGRAVAITIVQAGPVPYSDALGADRVLVLAFDEAIDLSKVHAEVLDRSVD
jgi:hypothetical protein